MNKKLIIGLLVLVVLALVLSSCKTEGEAWRRPVRRTSPTPTPSPAPTCGNNIINSNEVCDGSNLGGKTCTNLGYNEGTLSCCSDCTKFDLSKCKTITRTCKDYDNGPDYYIASNVSYSVGTVYGPSCSGPSPGGGGGGGTVSDTCNSSIILIERICNADNTVGSIEYECPNGCKNGACIKANIYYVSPTGAGSHDGSSPENAFNLNEAQNFANSNLDRALTFLLLDGNYGQITFNTQRSQYMTWKRVPDSHTQFEKIKVYGASHIEFNDLIIFGLGAHNQTVGIDIRNGNHITIKNSRIRETMTGISASGYKIDIRDNLIYSVGSDQIRIIEPANVIFIEGNRIFNTNPAPLAHPDGIQLYGFANISEVFIRNNIFNNLSGQGIFVDGTRDLTIEGNSMYGVNLMEIFLRNTHTGVITGNYIESYGNFSGIRVDNNTCTNIQVYNNIIV